MERVIGEVCRVGPSIRNLLTMAIPKVKNTSPGIMGAGSLKHLF